MNVQITTLDNGARVVTEAIPTTLSTSVGIWVNRGARHENQAQNGIAHFMEHMAFKGTNTRSALDIAESIENVGGYLNAYTSKDATAFYSRVLGEDTPLALDILTDILLNSSFEQSELELERGVILQEIGQTNDTPDDIIFDLLAEAAFPNQSIGRPILGTPESVSKFQADDFRNFINTNYGAGNLVISASGMVDHASIVSEVQQKLAPINYSAARDTAAVQFVSGLQSIQKPLEQAHFALALPAPDAQDDRQYAAHVLSGIMGGGMSSRLFQNIREKSGLAYTIFSSYSALLDTGQFLIYSGTSEDGLPKLMAQTAQELRSATHSLTQIELDRAKAQIRAGSVMSLENPSSRAERNARQMGMYDRIIPIEETLEKIDALTLDDISALASELFTQEPQIVTYGPTKSAIGFDDFLTELRG